MYSIVYVMERLKGGQRLKRFEPQAGEAENVKDGKEGVDNSKIVVLDDRVEKTKIGRDERREIYNDEEISGMRNRLFNRLT